MQGAKTGVEARSRVFTDRLRRFSNKALAPAVLLVIIVACYWKISLTSQFTWLENPDLAWQVLPWYQMQAREWHQGRFPLWDPYHWGGQTLIGQAQPGAAFPLNWLVFLLPLRDGFIQIKFLNYYLVFIHFLGAWFCYLLCRDLGRSAIASVAGGSLWALSGWFGTIGWPQMLNGAVWAPLVLMFFFRAARGDRPLRNSAWSGTFLGIALLSGHHQVPIFIALTLAGLWLYRLVAERAPVPLLKQALVLAIFCGVVGALQLAPAIEYGRAAVRWVSSENPIEWSQKVPYVVHSNYALRPQALLGLILPGIEGHANPYVGITAVALAALGLAFAWKDRVVRMMSAVAVFSLAFALGGSSLFHGVLYAIIPGVEKARNPSFAVVITQLAVAILVAAGLDSARESIVRLDWFYRSIIRACCVIALVVLLVATGLALARGERNIELERAALAAFLALATAGVLAAWAQDWFSNRAATMAVVGVMLLELSGVTTYHYRHREDGWPHLSKLSEHGDIAAFLRSQPGFYRTEIDLSEVPYNFGDWYGIETFEGYTASVPAVLHRIHSTRETRDLLGVRYAIARKAAYEGQKELFTGSGGLKVFENPGARPRAWAESDACQDGHRVETLSRRAGHTLLRVEMRCEGTVVINEANFPGWDATIDGRPVPVDTAHGLLQSVRVPSGHHLVALRYRPRSVWLGAWLSALGLLLSALLAAPHRRTLWSLSRIAVP